MTLGTHAGSTPPLTSKDQDNLTLSQKHLKVVPTILMTTRMKTKMKKLSLLLLFIGMSAIGQTKLYVHPNADDYAANTKSIAILPLDVQVKLRPKQLKDFSPEQIVSMEKSEALDIQKGMHSWFLMVAMEF